MVQNLPASIATVIGGITPVNPVIVPIAATVAGGTTATLDIRAVCSTPAVAEGTYKLLVSDTMRNPICENEIELTVVVQ